MAFLKNGSEDFLEGNVKEKKVSELDYPKKYLDHPKSQEKCGQNDNLWLILIYATIDVDGTWSECKTNQL